jgi:hypothetical protein
MHHFLTRAVVIVVAITTSILGGPQQTPPRARKGSILTDVSPEEYNRVLGLVFRSALPSGKDSVFSIIVRFRPSSAPESQIVIRQGRGLTGDVEYLTAEQNINATINEALQVTPEARPEVLARKVRVQRHSLNLSAARLFEIQSELFDSLKETMTALRSAGRTTHENGDVMVMLDGESYELWYEQGMTRLSGFFSASEADLSATPNGRTIGAWARALREELAHFVEGRRP